MAAIGTSIAGRIATAGVVEFGMMGRIHLGVCGARSQHTAGGKLWADSGMTRRIGMVGVGALIGQASEPALPSPGQLPLVGLAIGRKTAGAEVAPGTSRRSRTIGPKARLLMTIGIRRKHRHGKSNWLRAPDHMPVRISRKLRRA